MPDSRRLRGGGGGRPSLGMYGGQSESQGPYGMSVEDEEFIGKRLGLIERWAPEIAEDSPDGALEFASNRNLDDDEMMEAITQARDESLFEQNKQALEDMDDMEARVTFQQLPDSFREKLLDLGYQVPEPGDDGGFRFGFSTPEWLLPGDLGGGELFELGYDADADSPIAKGFSALGSVAAAPWDIAGDALGAVGHVSSMPYRAISRSVRAKYKMWEDGDLNFADPTTYSMIGNPADPNFRAAWGEVEKGEYTYREGAEGEARDLVGEKNFGAVQHFAAGKSATQIVEDEGLQLDTPEYTARMMELMEIRSDPKTQDAIKVLNQNKISIGRIVADSIFVGGHALAGEDFTVEDARQSTGYGMISGVYDGAYNIFTDPTIVLGPVAKSVTATRWGVRAAQVEDVATLQRRVDQILGVRGAVETRSAARLGRLGGRNRFRQAGEEVVRAINDPTPGARRDLLRRFPELTDTFENMLRWSEDEIRAGRRGMDSMERYADYWGTKNGWTQMVQGKVGGLRQDVRYLPSMGYRRDIYNKLVRSPAHRLMDKHTDLLTDDTWRMVLDDPEQAMKLINEGEDILEFEQANSFWKRMRATPGRLLATMTMQEPVNKGVIPLMSAQATTEFRNLLNFGMYANVPTEVRDRLMNEWLSNPTAAMRGRLLTTFMDEVLTRSGLRALPEGKEIYEQYVKHARQIYGVGEDGEDLLDALYPDTQIAQAAAIPDLSELLGMTRYMSTTRRIVGRLSHSWLDDMIGKVWKPSVVGRLGFIPRAIGDELLADIARHGPVSYLRTRVLSMNWARHGTLDRLADRGWDAGKNRGWLVEHIARREGMDVPTLMANADDVASFEFMAARPFQWMAHSMNRFARHFAPESKFTGRTQWLENMMVDANFWLGDTAHAVAMSRGRFTKAELAKRIGGPQVEREVEVIRRLTRHSPTYVDAKMRLGARHLAADPRAFDEGNRTMNRMVAMRQPNGELVNVPLIPLKGNERLYRNPMEHQLGDDANNLDLREINGNLGDYYDSLAGVLSQRMDDRVGQEVLREVMTHAIDDHLVDDLLPFSDELAVVAGDPKELVSRAQARFDLLPEDVQEVLKAATTNLDEAAGLQALAMSEMYGAPVVSQVDAFLHLSENAKHFLVNGSSDNFLYGTQEVLDRARQVVAHRLGLPDMAQAHRDLRRLHRSKDGRQVIQPVPAGHTPMYGVFGDPDLSHAIRTANPQDLRANLIGRLQAAGHKDPERLADEIVEDFFPDEQFFQSRDYDILATSHHRSPQAPLSLWGTTNQDVAEAVQRAIGDTLPFGVDGTSIARLDVADDAIHSALSPRGFDNGVVARGGRGHTWEDSESFQLGAEKWTTAQTMAQPRRMVKVPPELRQHFDGAGVAPEDLALLQEYGVIDAAGRLSDDLDDVTEELLSEIRLIRDWRDQPEWSMPGVQDMENLAKSEKVLNLLTLHGKKLDDTIPLDEWKDLRRANPDLPDLPPTHLDGGATLSEVRQEMADDLVADLMGLVGSKRMLHEVINPTSKGVFDRRHLLNGVAANELPLKAYGPTMYAAPPPGKWGNLVRFGFDKVIGPPIDSMVRSPQYIRSVAAAMEWADKGADLFIRNPELVKNAAKVAGKHDQKLGDLMGAMDELSDDLLKPSAKVDDVARALGLDPGKLTGQDLAALRSYRSNWRAAEEYVANVSNERAVMELMNYIDDNRIKSYFQTNVRNLVPFHFAEEQFIKRYGRSLMMSPDAIRRGQLTMHALRTSGIIKEDEFGNQVIVYPLVGPAMGMIGAAGSTVWGDWKVPVPVTMTGEVKFLSPGFDTFSEGRPGFAPGPMVALPLWGLSNMFPEMQGLEDAVTGRQGYSRDIWDFVIPSSMKRFVDAMNPQETQTNQLSAMQYMASIDPDGSKGIFLKPDAEPGEQQEFLDRVKNWARILGITRGVFGFSVPASPQAVVDPELNIENVTDEWDPKFVDYMRSGLPLDEALAQYLEFAHNEYGRDMTPYSVFATKSKSGAIMPASAEYLDYSQDNREFLERYPYAAPWLGPQNDDPDGFNRRAYYDQIIHGMRVRKDPEEWVNDMHDARASKDYFDRQRQYQLDILGAEDGSEDAKMITQEWEDWKRRYLQQHPLFKMHLESGEGRTRRGLILSEMRKVLSDPEIPDEAGYNDAMKELVDAYDDLKNAQFLLKDDSRLEARERKQQMRADFVDYALALVEQEPGLMGFFNSVIWPELELDGNPFQTPEVVAGNFDLLEGD